jgi:glycosyltransferase involved in cell wall biosynthesis
LDNVIKIDYWDIDAMADAIHGLISYPAFHRELKVEGVEEMKGITWEKAGRKVIDIYEKVIKK